MFRQLNIFKHPAICRESTYEIHFHGAKLRRIFLIAGWRDFVIFLACHIQRNHYIPKPQNQ
jgi:hypothetical protein